MIFVMSTGLCASLACRFHVTLGEVVMGESGGMEVVGGDGRIGEVDEQQQGMGEVRGLDFLGEDFRPLGGSFFGVW